MDIKERKCNVKKSDFNNEVEYRRTYMREYYRKNKSYKKKVRCNVCKYEFRYADKARHEKSKIHKLNSQINALQNKQKAISQLIQAEI